MFQFVFLSPSIWKYKHSWGKNTSLACFYFSNKRGIDFGLGRGYYGNQAAKHFMGLLASRYGSGPGKKRSGRIGQMQVSKIPDIIFYWSDNRSYSFKIKFYILATQWDQLLNKQKYFIFSLCYH